MIAYMKDPDINTEQMMQYIPGPDFPTGGIVANKDELLAVYSTGMGKIKIRGKVEVEKGKGGKDRLVITEIPYTMIGANIGKFLNDIYSLVEAKKTSDIVDITNQSSKEGIRIVLELKKGADVENLKNLLYKKQTGSKRYLMKNDSLKGQHRINEQIRAKEVRIVGDEVEPKVYPIAQALRLAEEHEADLVEISPNAQPPVCRIIDYSKFLYQLKKRQKEQKAKQVKVNVKEIRFGPQTDDHDYNFKLKHAKGFLEDGDKVKAYVFFKGRSILFKEQGEVLLLRFANDLEDYAKVDQMPVLEGKRMTIQLSPKKVAAPKKSAAPKPAEDAPKAASAETEEE
mgnify:CR=1 FL=1